VAVSAGEPRAYVEVLQCGPQPATTSAADCDGRTVRRVRVLPDGTVETPKKLTAVLQTAGGTLDCRRAPAEDPCTLALRTDTSVADPPVVAAAPLRFDRRSRREPPATLTAEPATGAVDGQAVHVHGERFDVGVGAAVLLCRRGSPDTLGCHPAGRPPRTSEEGVLDTDITVYAVFTSIGFQRVDCRPPGACELVALHTRWDEPPARAPLAFAPGQVVAEPTATVTPALGLVDQQTVALRASGFAPGDWIEVALCTPSSCPRIGTALVAAPDGTVDVPDFLVPARVPGDGTDCRRPPGRCTLVLRASGGRFAGAHVPLRFDRRAPLGPGPSFTLDPATGVVAGQAVTVTAAHLWPGGFMAAYQCPAGADPGDLAGCAYLPTSSNQPDGGGDLVATFAADPVIRPESGGAGTDCRTAPAGCLVVLSGYGRGLLTAPIAYAP
jgi:hypothetical protein